MELSSIILCIFVVDQELVQEVRCPTKHYPLLHTARTAMTPAGASSFLHFLNKLASHELVGKPCHIIVDVSKNNAHFPSVGTKLFLDYLDDLLLAHFVIQVFFVCAPTMGNPVILEINATSSYTGLSIQEFLPCTRASNCLTHNPTILPCLKCGMSRRFMIPEL
jgi:hypothetical protein